MLKVKMNCHCRFVIWFVGVFVLESIFAADTICYMNVVNKGCLNPNESCAQDKIDSVTGVCKCKQGYSRLTSNDNCTLTRPITTPGPHGDDKPTTPAPDHSSKVSGSTIAASILIPLVLVVAVVGLLYSARRYQWLHRLHQLRQRRYDEVRIGQEDDDDPPIA